MNRLPINREINKIFEKHTPFTEETRKREKANAAKLLDAADSYVVLTIKDRDIVSASGLKRHNAKYLVMAAMEWAMSTVKVIRRYDKDKDK